LKAAGDDVQSKVTGVKIYTAIASKKAAANKKTQQMKDKMTRALVEAKEDAKVNEALETFETEAKKIADDLKVDIKKVKEGAR
jgi:predicted transcriptional regulator